MTPVDADARERLRPLYAPYACERVFIDGCLDGQWGAAWADNPHESQVALLFHAFVYLAGDPTARAAREAVTLAAPLSESVIAPSEDWGTTLRAVHGDRFALQRWTLLTSRQVERTHLEQLARAPDGCRVERIDRALARRLYDDGVLVFRTYGRSPERFAREGVGYCLTQGDEIVSVINAMGVYNGQLKGSVQTHPDYRGRGFATVVAARLVAHCLDHGIEYCWEATNPASIALATKLGLTPAGERLAYQQAEETITIENRLGETVYVHVEGPLGRERRAELPTGVTCRRRALRGQRWVAYVGDRRVATLDIESGARTWVIARTVLSD